MNSLSGDLLSALALALAAQAVLYGIWQSDIRDALALAKPRHLHDRTPQLTSMKGTLRQKALPLAAGGAAISLTMAPPVFSIFKYAATIAQSGTWHALSSYDPVSALFLVVWIIGNCLTFQSIKDLTHLTQQIRMFEQP